MTTAIQTLSAALTEVGIENRVEKFDDISTQDDLIIVVHPGREIFIQVEHGYITVNEWFEATQTDTCLPAKRKTAVAIVQKLIANPSVAEARA